MYFNSHKGTIGHDADKKIAVRKCLVLTEVDQILSLYLDVLQVYFDFGVFQSQTK